jgi:nitrate/nitrite transport system substrate-binding protein
VGPGCRLFKKYGIESTISKEVSWAVIRDRLSLGENQATHLLLGIPYASTMGLLGSPVKPMIIPCHLNRNGQAITRTKEPSVKGVKTPQTLKPLIEEAKRAGQPMIFAMTFSSGTHAMWTRNHPDCYRLRDHLVLFLEERAAQDSAF